MKKEIRMEKMRVGDIKHGFGNPRKIKKKKAEELERSIDMFGDFGVIVIDENDNVICGNQRSLLMARKDPEQIVDVKRNIKDNTHAGEWDLDLLADWTADLAIDIGLDLQEKNPDERKIPDMELIRYEKYDYVIIACRNEVDYANLTRALGIDGAKILIAKRRKIKARAVWYDDMKAQIVPKKEVKKKDKTTEDSKND